MTNEIPNGVREFVSAEAQYRARLYFIEAPDGPFLRLTDHHTTLRDEEGLDYEPAGASSVSAHSEATGGEDYDRSYNGALTSDTISERDLVRGVWRGSKITEKTVDWRYPFIGPITTRVYFCEECRWTASGFEMRTTGILGKVRATLGGQFSRQCVADLGSFHCGVDPAAIPNAFFPSLSIVEIVSNTVFKIDPVVVPPGLGDDWFQWGTVRFTLGANRNKQYMVALYDDANRQITLSEEPGFDLTLDNGGTGIPDRIDLTAGCDKTRATCAGKWGNFLNFQGQPFVRGSDNYLETPSS